jgi:endonuclease V-like protein UPF0215 family
LNIGKKGIRAFGVAESFRKPDKLSTIAGIVMRRDLVIDGLAFGCSTVGGDDSTQTILSMFSSLARNDINCIILDGLIISMYNIIDGYLIHNETRVPVIAISYHESSGLTDHIIHLFEAEQRNTKLDQYSKIGERDQIVLRTGKNLFIRVWGINCQRAVKVLDAFTLQGSIPEPVRVAKLFARARSVYKG